MLKHGAIGTVFTRWRRRYEQQVLDDRDPVTGEIKRPYRLFAAIAGIIIFLVVGGLIFLTVASNRARIATLESTQAKDANQSGGFLAERLVELCAQPTLPVQISNLCPRASEVATAITEQPLEEPGVIIVVPSATTDETVLATSNGVPVPGPVGPAGPEGTGPGVAVTGPAGLGVSQIQCLETGDWQFSYTDGTNLTIPGPCRIEATTGAQVTVLSTVTESAPAPPPVVTTETQVQTQTVTETEQAPAPAPPPAETVTVTSTVTETVTP